MYSYLQTLKALLTLQRRRQRYIITMDPHVYMYSNGRLRSCGTYRRKSLTALRLHHFFPIGSNASVLGICSYKLYIFLCTLHIRWSSVLPIRKHTLHILRLWTWAFLNERIILSLVNMIMSIQSSNFVLVRSMLPNCETSIANQYNLSTTHITTYTQLSTTLEYFYFHAMTFNLILDPYSLIVNSYCGHSVYAVVYML